MALRSKCRTGSNHRTASDHGTGSNHRTARDVAGRRKLQLTVGALSAIPLASGLTGVLAGPSVLPRQAGAISATLDSQYRFANAFWLATAPIVWASLPRIERRGKVLGLAGATIFAGGVARLLSIRKTGRPHPLMLGALGIELVGVPALLAWQAIVARAMREE